MPSARRTSCGTPGSCTSKGHRVLLDQPRSTGRVSWIALRTCRAPNPALASPSETVDGSHVRGDGGALDAGLRWSSQQDWMGKNRRLLVQDLPLSTRWSQPEPRRRRRRREQGAGHRHRALWRTRAPRQCQLRDPHVASVRRRVGCPGGAPRHPSLQRAAHNAASQQRSMCEMATSLCTTDATTSCDMNRDGRSHLVVGVHS